MATNLWTPLVGWVATIGAAAALGLAAPNEGWLLGKVPTLSAKRLDQTQVVIPQQLPAQRTIAVVSFRRDQRVQAQRWIEGLGLEQRSDIAWLQVPVWGLQDLAERESIEQDLAQRYPSPSDKAHVLPVFTDRDDLVRALGLGSTDQASVLVLDRDGNVLARAEGDFDESKAQALRDTASGS